MATAAALKPSKQLPPPNADFFQFADTLSDEKLAIVSHGVTRPDIRFASEHAVPSLSSLSSRNIVNS
mgnify:CR=1 FL=1